MKDQCTFCGSSNTQPFNTTRSVCQDCDRIYVTNGSPPPPEGKPSRPDTPADMVALWLQACLDCETWNWDPDQRAAATESLKEYKENKL